MPEGVRQQLASGRLEPLRDHDPRQQHAGRSRDDGGHQDVGRRIGQGGLQNGRIGHHGRAGDRRQTHHHHQEEFGTGQLVEIGPNDDGALDHAQEDIGGHGQGRGPAQAHGLLEDEAEAPGDPFQDLPVPEQGRQGRDHQDQGQDLEGKDKQGPIIGHHIGLGPAAHIAKDELGALGRGRGQAIDPVIDSGDDVLGPRQTKQHQDETDLDHQGPKGQAPWEFAFLL